VRVLKTPLCHPEILQALASAGHGSRVLLADANYPFSTGSPPSARKVFLNLRLGLVAVADVLTLLEAAIPIESAFLMEPPDGSPVAIHATLREILPRTAAVELRRRQEFYAEVQSPATALVIATGEARRFANVLLTIGVVSRETPFSSSP
jgi:L-fucose mutarotase